MVRYGDLVMVRGFILILLYVAILIVILFGAAGDWGWGLGWAALGIRFAISLAAFFLVEPELVRERSQIRAGTRGWDIVLATISAIFACPLTLAVAGLDVGRYGWSPALGWCVQLPALVVFALGNGLALLAALHNPYFSTFVRLQADRGHAVIREGPYRQVRHPAYAGIIAAALALPIALGSLWALLPAAVGAVGFWLRTLLEDKELRQGLADYQGYADQVRYRLLPGVW